MKDHSKFRSSVRMGMHEYFLEIALASYESYQNLYEELKKLRAEGFFVYGEEPNIHFAYNRHDEVFQSEQQLLLSGDLDGVDYKAVKIECEDQITSLENKLFDVSSPKINIENQLKDAVNVLLNLDLLYKNGTVAIKRDIIGSIFPEKLSFDGTQHRTTRVNEVVSIICMISSELESKKKRANDLFKCLPARVA